MIKPSNKLRLPVLWVAMALCLVPATEVRGNIRFFTKVMQNIQHYRLAGDMVQFNLEGQGTGNLTFYLTLPSRRNNIDEVLMGGYLSVGYAIDRTGLKVKTVYVTAATGERHVVTKVDAALLAKLLTKQISPNKFLGLIERIE
ncbi:MAG: hypothetical protein IIC41_04585 [Candidatus Marinimicrobia bacterium]|nr:hypothetical protein [Candidatus Neomarinimicrobiota bacterium]